MDSKKVTVFMTVFILYNLTTSKYMYLHTTNQFHVAVLQNKHIACAGAPK